MSSKYNIWDNIMLWVKNEFSQGRMAYEVEANYHTIKRIRRDAPCYGYNHPEEGLAVIHTWINNILLRVNNELPDTKVVLKVRKMPPPPYEGPVEVDVRIAK